jgi:chorismate synthase
LLKVNGICVIIEKLTFEAWHINNNSGFMGGSTYGTLFKISTFGESHGAAIGVVIDGCPPGIHLNLEAIQNELLRRKPGQSKITTSRNEDNSFEILSGLTNGITTGTPLTLLVRNSDQRSGDYEHLKNIYRPGHADYTYDAKYGIREVAGGGRSSARETVARVLAGAVAKQLLLNYGITIQAFVHQVGQVTLKTPWENLDLSATESSIVRCPDKQVTAQMEKHIEEVAVRGDSVGGAITCVIKNVPAGWGEPVFDKLHAELGKSILSINACKGFEIGSGFNAAASYGSLNNDEFTIVNNEIRTITNNSGGVLGGISNGEPIYFKCAFKPVSTIKSEQQTITIEKTPTTFAAVGRHDPCVVPRAVPIVEAMAAITLADFALRQASVGLSNKI